MPSGIEITAELIDSWAPLRLWRRRPGDCGPCCLYLVLRHHGVAVTPDTVRRATGWNWRGSSLQGLARGAASLGLEATCVRMDVQRVPDVSQPAIAHFQGNHFVVVRGADARQVLVADPRLGLGQVSRTTFEEMWSGHLLQLTPPACGAPMRQPHPPITAATVASV